MTASHQMMAASIQCCQSALLVDWLRTQCRHKLDSSKATVGRPEEWQATFWSRTYTSQKAPSTHNPDKGEYKAREGRSEIHKFNLADASSGGFDKSVLEV
ncbi:MAG: hypothetical protein QOH48_2457 [Actinomycetota bacterium]|jgi:hypothetical protein|nr:hypothetical protein [Actinomycetota bacterium]